MCKGGANIEMSVLAPLYICMDAQTLTKQGSNYRHIILSLLFKRLCINSSSGCHGDQNLTSRAVVGRLCSVGSQH